MSRNEQIHHYLTELETYLSRVSNMHAQEVVQEIESHIYDAIELQQAGNPGSIDIDSILARLGTPRELASGYVEHITTGVAPPKGLKPLAGIRKGISKSLFYLTTILGFGTGAALILMAFVKLFAPSAVGVWVAEHGNSIVLSFNNHAPQANEIAGVWLFPIASATGLLLLFLTHRITRILKLHLQS